MAQYTPKRYIRPVFITLLLLLAIVTCVLLWASANYKQYIKAHLAEKVSTATDGQYSASIQDVDISLFSRRLTVTGLEFWPDTMRQMPVKETGHHIETTIKLSVPKFQLSGVQLLKLIFQKQLSVNDAVIWNGKLLIVSKEREVDSSRMESKKKQSFAISKLIADAIHISNPDITFQYIGLAEKDRFTTTLKGGNATLNNWLLDPEKKDTVNLLYAQTVIIDSPALVFDKPSMRYLIKVPSVYFNTDEHKLKAQGMGIHPYVDNATFYAQLGHRTTIWNTDIPYFELLDFNWRQLLNSNTIWATHLNISRLHMDLFFNYLVPSKPTNMISEDPPRVFLTLPIKINITEINVDNSHISYTEINERSHRAGRIYFDHINAHGNNLSNIDSVIAKKQEFTANADGVMYDKSKATASLKLSLADLTGKFELDGQIRDIDAQQLREPVEALAQLRIDSLNLRKMDIHVAGDQNHSQSKLGMDYSNLKLELVRSKTPPALKAKPLISEVASLFFLYKENPEPGKPARTATAYMERDVMAPYLSLIVKNLKIAAKEMVIKHPETVSTITNDKDLKSQKKSFLQKVFSRKKKSKQ